MTRAKQSRQKRVREGHMDPAVKRKMWERKPMTQVVPNRKKEERRTYCRKGGQDGVFLWTGVYPSTFVD